MRTHALEEAETYSASIKALLRLYEGSVKAVIRLFFKALLRLF
jgi:hypothetical protein